MTIAVKCKACAYSWKVSERDAGEQVRCPECRATVRIPDSKPGNRDDNQPRRPRSGKPRSGRRKKRRGAPVGLILGLVLGGVVLAAGGVAAVLILRHQSDSGPTGGIAAPERTDNPNVAMQNFRRIKHGMSQDQVFQILGKGIRVPRGEVSRAMHVPEPIGGFGNDTTTIEWTNGPDTLLIEFNRIGVMAGWFLTERPDGKVDVALL